MRRQLFEHYQIDDQNHEFVSSRQGFMEGLKEKLISDVFRINFNSIDAEQSPLGALYKTLFAEQDNEQVFEFRITDCVLTLSFKEEYLNERLVERSVELIYVPNISISVNRVKVSIYKVDMIGFVDFDIDEIMWGLKKYFKKRSLNFMLNEDLSTRMVFSADRSLVLIKPHSATLDVVVTNRNSASDVIWEIVKLLEENYFRTVDKNDF